MKKLILLFLVFLSIQTLAQTNVTFYSNLNQYPAQGYNDIWGYVDGTGIEYALLGCGHGTSIVRIDNPSSPLEVAFIAGPSSSWRDIKTHGAYAYIVTEGTGTGRGLQIVDLSQLPTTATLVNTIETWFTRAHNIFIDNGYAYVIGTNNGGGMHILDLSNPVNPTRTAYYSASNYIHDVYVWNDTVVAAAEDTYDLVNVSNKTNPQLISSSIALPGIYAHSGWMTVNKRYFVACEEFNVRDITVWDLVDRTNWDLVVSNWHLPTGSSIIHNLFIKGNFAHISYYTSGYVVLDISDPTNLVFVGQYDTYPANDAGTYNGAWGCYPFLPSGNTIISDIQTGLYVLHFDGEVATFPLSVSVADGWNMVSVPGNNPNGQGVDNWWSGRDPGTNVFEFSGGYASVTTTQPGTGYWMKNLGSQLYNTGDEWPSGGIEVINHTPLTATSGWNLIGGYENTVSTLALSTTPPGLIDGPVYKYSSGYQAADSIVPGYGYWIKLTASGQINIPESSNKIYNKELNYIDESWGRIKITDNTGNNYILYIVNEQVNPDQFELPPVPPAGMFDIRFASGKIAENITRKVQTIEMSGVVYPIKVYVDGVNINLSDETGMEVDARLQSGEEISINKLSLNKLIVSAELNPLEYSLEQNYPNPFNPTTTIKFAIPEPSNVILNIYNSLGQNVESLVNGYLEAGHYSFPFNGNNLASGIYVYALKTDKFVAVNKMILIK